MPMKTMQPYDFDEKHLQFPCCISPKLDGVRVMDDGHRFVFRSGKPVYGVNDLYLYAGSLGIEGELLIPGIKFAQSAGQIRSHDPSPDAHLYVFDYHNNAGAVFADRYARLRQVKWYTDRIHIIRHEVVHNYEEIMEHHRMYLEFGLEGSVIKTLNHQYQYRRSWDWMRMVPVKSVNLKVIQVYEGGGKYTNMLGGVIALGDGISVKIGTGFNDDQRYKFWAKPYEILGKTISVKYREKTKDGSLRHPSFDGIRDDL